MEYQEMLFFCLFFFRKFGLNIKYIYSLEYFRVSGPLGRLMYFFGQQNEREKFNC